MLIQNTVILTGTSDSLSRFYQTLTLNNFRNIAVGFSFHQTIPIVVDVNAKKLGKMMKGHWGCKSDALDYQILIKSESEFIVRFDTMDDAPSEWARRLIILHPELTLKLASIFDDHSYYQVEVFKYGQRTRHQYDITHEDSLANNETVQGEEGDDPGEADEVLNPNGRYAEFLRKYHFNN